MTNEMQLSRDALLPQQPSWSPSRRSIVIMIVVFTGAWLSLLNWAVLSPPTDNIEQLIWVRSLEWGYYKHPPLPTWLLWPMVQLFGWNAWATYLMGAACTLAAFALMWHMLRGMRGDAYATTAVLAAMCITFYNGRLYFYNHEIVLIPLVAGCAAACWKAYSSRRIGWWIVLGVCLGFGALAKYQIAVAALAILAFWCSRKAWRDSTHLFGLLLAGLTALAVFMPHLVWLLDHDFEPLRYAKSSSLAAGLPWTDRMREIARWWGDQLLNRALPAWVFLTALWLLGRHSPRAAGTARTGLSHAGDGAAARALLLCFGFTPLLFVSAMTLVSGSHIQLHWGTPFLLFIVPAALELTRANTCVSFVPRRAMMAFIIIQLLLMARVELTAPNGAALLRRTSDWRYFDAQRLADVLHPLAVAELGGPVRVISGPWEESGALALRLQEKPVVLIQGQQRFSPWVQEQVVADCGVLELSKARTQPKGYSPVGPAFPLLYWRTTGHSSPTCE